MTIKKNTKIWSVAFIVLAIAIFTFTNKIRKSPDPKNVGTFSFPTVKNTDKLSLKVFKTNTGWAYEIYINKTLFIVQESIPSLPGRIPFANKKDAEACGKLVVSKLERMENPSVSKEDLEKLKIEIPK